MAADHPELESAINGPVTVGKVISVLPPQMTYELTLENSGMKQTDKQELLSIKIFLEKRRNVALKLTKHSEDLKKSQLNYGFANPFVKQKGGKNPPSALQYEQNNDGHNCFIPNTPSPSQRRAFCDQPLIGDVTNAHVAVGAAVGAADRRPDAGAARGAVSGGCGGRGLPYSTFTHDMLL